ncbi:TPA: hypothetical protein DD394_04725 [bacterium UBP9_UBA11836]|nr:hypothetical protein [bacterium UBP9_UBA11836]
MCRPSGLCETLFYKKPLWRLRLVLVFSGLGQRYEGFLCVGKFILFFRANVDRKLVAMMTKSVDGIICSWYNKGAFVMLKNILT